jgi:UDP-N-acetylmuramate: L-alanyl-gamma-D-glutamyl-meso-diaminopimelate ligase
MIASTNEDRLNVNAYNTLPYKKENGATSILWEKKQYPMLVFGDHNLQNMNGARLVCNELGISNDQFLTAMQSFKGAAKRLQLLSKNQFTNVYLDFAHSPSKLAATTSAMKQQFDNRKLLALMELHTFSSLNKDFLPQYKGTMDTADEAIVFFNPKVLEHKKLPPISKEDVLAAFGRADLRVFTSSEELSAFLKQQCYINKNLLIMTSGNFSGIDIRALANELV